MMRVLHYIPSIDRSSGGVGVYMQLLAKGLGQLCDLHVITHHSADEYALPNCTLHYIDPKWLPWNNCKSQFVALLQQLNPDVVHVNCCWTPLCSFIALWTKALGKKVVYTPHGMLEPWILRRHYYTRKLPAILLYQRRAIRKADVLHATADSEKQNLLRLGWNPNVDIVGNCVDVNAIAMKTSWQRTRTILFLSRVHVKKGINFLIEALSQITHSANPNAANIAKVQIAGPGDEAYVAELRILAQQLGVADKVEFLGPVFGDKKYELFRSADCFVLPTHSENFGIVVTEALACGTPVITTQGTPWSELPTAHCGWWTEIGTAPTAEALTQFLALSPNQIETMGRNGRRLVEEKYSCQIIAQQMMSLYNQLLAR